MAIQAVCFLMSHCILGIANERLGQIVSFHCFLTLTNLNLIMYLFSAGISGGLFSHIINAVVYHQNSLILFISTLKKCTLFI